MLASIRLIVLGLIMAALGGCATSVVSTKRSSELASPVGSAVVMVYSAPMGPQNTAPSALAVLGALSLPQLPPPAEHIAEDTLAMTREMAKQLPLALDAVGLKPQGPVIIAEAYPATYDAKRALLPEDVKDAAPLLFVHPLSATMECYRSCFAFLVRVQLLQPQTGKELWSAMVQMRPKAAKFLDFSGPVTSFGETLVAQLKKDGVVR